MVVAHLSEAALSAAASLVPLAALGVMTSVAPDDKRSGVSASMSSSMLPADQVKRCQYLLHSPVIVLATTQG